MIRGSPLRNGKLRLYLRLEPFYMQRTRRAVFFIGECGQIAAKEILLADEAGYIWRCRCKEDVLNASHLCDAPVLEGNNGVRQLLGLIMIVRHKDNGDAKMALEAFQRIAQTLAHGDIERVERLIQQQQARLSCQSARQGDTLLLPTGKRSRILLLQPLQFQRGQQFIHASVLRLPFPSSLEAAWVSSLLRQGKADILGDGEMREKGVVLRDIANVAFL